MSSDSHLPQRYVLLLALSHSVEVNIAKLQIFSDMAIGYDEKHNGLQALFIFPPPANSSRMPAWTIPIASQVAALASRRAAAMASMMAAARVTM